MIQPNKLPTLLGRIEYSSTEGTGGGLETFSSNVFSGYEVEERVPYLGETRARIGDVTLPGSRWIAPPWKP